MQVPGYVRTTKVRVWVEEMVVLCQPDHVYWCDGSQEEYDGLCEQMVELGTFLQLNSEKCPTAFWLAPIPAMLLTSKTGPSSALSAKAMLVQPTTGCILKR